MANEVLNEYIEKRYERWLDYAKYHCSLSGMIGEEIDILNEVLAMLLEKPEPYLLRLLESKQGKYTELDFYILQMIKLNVTSDTSPYRHKYRSIPKDENIDWRRLNIPDEVEEEEDRSGYILERFQEVREIIKELRLSDKALRIFTWKFFAGESFSDWPGPENKKELYRIYKNVLEAILEKKRGILLL